MVSYTQVKQGLSGYITNEIIAKMAGWQQWVAGAFVSLAMTRTDQIFDTIRSNPAVKLLGVISEDGMVDIDALHTAFRQQAKDSVQIDLPMLGAVTLAPGDIDLIYQYIKQGG